ncbi:MAG TPA: AAA family ATPase [Chloroflexota bacterium]|nr:AAA family ATPase [Chloroflexota bacterium]
MSTNALPARIPPHAVTLEDLLFRTALCLAGLAVALYLWPLTLCGGVLWLLWCVPPSGMRPPRYAALLMGVVCCVGAVAVFRSRGVDLLADFTNASAVLAAEYQAHQLAVLDALLPMVMQAAASGAMGWAAAVPSAVSWAYLSALAPYGLFGGTAVGVWVAVSGGSLGNLGVSTENTHTAHLTPTALAAFQPKGQRADKEARRTGGGTAWLIHGLVGRQSLTIISGPYKGGKSTLVCALVRALLTGEPVLGLAATKAPRVRWFTEESPGSMRQKLRQWGLADKRLELIYRGQSAPGTWPALLAHLERTVKDGEVVIVDTLAVHVSNQPGAENSTDVMTEAMEGTRKVAQRKGIAVVFVHHDNAGGKMRGSVAIGASVDVIGHVRLPDGGPYAADEAVRHWTAESRVDETPRSLYLRLVRPENGDVPHYDVLADPEVEKEGKKRVTKGEKPPVAVAAQPVPVSPSTPKLDRGMDILRVLEAAGAPCSMEAIAAKIGVHRTGLLAPMKLLITHSFVTRTGTGSKADPVRYVVAEQKPLG